MLQNKELKIIILLCIIHLTNNVIISQCIPDLGNYFVSQDTADKHIFRSIEPLIYNSKIIGIGEDTHGSSEFTLLITYLIDYLVEDSKSVGVFLEMSVGEAKALNDYIHGSRNDYDHIINNINTSWRYKTLEFKSFIERVTELNNENKDISIYGTEVQIVKEAKNIINRYLEEHEADILLSGFDYHIWMNVATTSILNDLIDVQKVESYLDENKKRLIILDEREYQLILNLMYNLKNFLSINLQDFDDVKHDLRDIYMAQNIIKIIEQDEHEKYVYWAHNSHVGKDQQNGPADVAGRELHKRFRNEYFVIKTDFGEGEFMAYPHDANETGWNMNTMSYGTIEESTISFCLNDLLGSTSNVGLLNIKKAVINSPILNEYLSNPVNEMSGAGSQMRSNRTTQIELYPSFDAIIYYKKSTPITFLR